MGRPETAAMLLTVALAASACSGDDEGPGLGAIETPTFSEDREAQSTMTEASDETTTTTERLDAPQETATTTGRETDTGSVTTATSTATTEVPIESVSFDDPVGDATAGVGTSAPPAWSDLAGATLDRRANAYRLTVRLGGNRAPERSDGDSTMNIASFFDVDGDGAIDYEIWANLGPEGWGAAWYDDQDRGAFGEDSNVTVLVQGESIVLLFPDVMLGTPDRFRFSLASEYGELSTIGSSFARRDDAPDGDRAVTFPG